MEETREEFLNLYMPRIENSNEREVTHTTRSAEGARVWSELFVPDTPDERIKVENRTTLPEEDPLTSSNVVVGSRASVQSSTVVQNNAGAQNNTGTQNSTDTQNSTSTQNNAGAQQTPPLQKKVVMAGPKEKLSKFNGDEAADPIRHCKTCKTIWMVNGVTDQDDWVLQFRATLRGVAIDWFADADPQKLTTWLNVKKEFIIDFQLLRDDNELVAEIYSTKQGKNETTRVYAIRLKESPSANGLKKQWFVKGLQSALKKKMKIVPPASYTNAYNRVMDLDSEQKTSKKKHKSSDSDDSSSESSSTDEELSKQFRAL